MANSQPMEDPLFPDYIQARIEDVIDAAAAKALQFLVEEIRKRDERIDKLENQLAAIEQDLVKRYLEKPSQPPEIMNGLEADRDPGFP